MTGRFEKWERPAFDKKGMTKWSWMCQHFENLKLGKHVDIGAFTYINARYGVELQDFFQIGSHCSIYSVSTIDNKIGKILIKKNARVGTHSVIMPGIIIGKNSCVGAFSFVNQNIPNNVLAYGVPAAVRRKLTQDEIKRIIDETKGEQR